MKRVKILFANMNASSPNKGCLALGESTLYICDKILTNHGYSYEFILADSGLDKKGKTVLCIGERNIQVTIVHSFKHSIKSVALALLKKDFFQYISAIYHADIIFDIGHGDSFSDIYGKNRFIDIDRIHKLARLFRKPFYLLPQTIGPFKESLVDAKKSLMRSKLVLVRDKQSLDFVNEICQFKAKVIETIDVAFVLPYSKTSTQQNNLKVGINISGLLHYDVKYAKENFNLKDDYCRLIKSIIDYFVSISVEVHIVSHVLSDKPIYENDYYVSKCVYEQYKGQSVVLSPFFFDASEAKSYIANLDFFIGSRMHATIAAFSSGVPVVPLSYSRKFLGLFVDTLNYQWVGDLCTMKNEDIMRLICQAFTNRDKIKTIIDERMNGIVKERINLLEKLVLSIIKENDR